MKICLINNLYEPYARGGAERMVGAVADGLREAGYDVLIITTRPFGGKREAGKEQRNTYYIPGIYSTLNRLPKFIRLAWHLKNIFDLYGYRRVKAILKRERPEAVITHNLMGLGYLVPRAAGSLGIRHIHTLHDIQLLHPSGLMIYGREHAVDSPVAGIYQYLCKRFFDFTDIVISPTKWLLQEHEKRGFFRNTKKVILANPNPDTFITVSPRRDAVRKFLYVGQVEEHKGVLFLINVFNEFCKLHPGAGLKIVGDGSALPEAVRSARGNRSIEFTGKLCASDVKRTMLESDCLIVPSLCYENAPVVVSEAFACGLPVIAAYIGGIPELLSGAGFTFVPGNKKDLIRKMESVGSKKSDNLDKRASRNIDDYIRELVNVITR